MLALEDVTKRFGLLPAVEGVSLALAPGRTTVVLGPSGCGKSTLLRLMSALETPDEGRVLFDGTRLEGEHVTAARRRMGHVTQEGGLFPHLTARRNVTLVPEWLGWEKARIASRVEELADLTRLPSDALARYPSELSGGQRQRVALMRALVLDPDVLLLDEPLGALDPLIRMDVQEDLRVVFRKLGKTVAMVTHDLAEAAWFADVVVLMRDGHIVQQGPFADLVERPTDDFVRRFVQAQRSPVP